MKGQGHGSRIPDRRAVLKGASVLGLAGVASAAFAQDVLADLDATGLAQKVRAREVTPLELLEAAINRAEAVNGRLNCLSETLYDRARARADRIAPEGAFAGVHYLLKDETELAGVRRHLGSRIDGSLAMSTKTNPTISRMEAAGVNVFGRTTMSEFGALPTTETEAYGVTRNPWSLQHTPGGSSGGAAAAVAAGIIPMADAWDGAGSIRIPASNCGLVGLKLSRGRTPSPDRWFPELNLSSHFCVSRTVRDSANLLAVVETSGVDGLPPIGRVKGAASQGRRDRDQPGRAPSPEVIEALTAAVRLLEGLGHDVREDAWPLDLKPFRPTSLRSISRTATAWWIGWRRTTGWSARR